MTESEMSCKFDKKKTAFRFKIQEYNLWTIIKNFSCHLLRIKDEFTRTNVDFIQIFAKSYVIVV